MKDLGAGTKRVFSRGYGQRRQHQQPGRNDQNGVLGKRRDLWIGQRFLKFPLNAESIKLFCEL